MPGLGKIFVKVTEKQSQEFGQVAVLATIIFTLYTGEKNFLIAALILSFITLTIPSVFYPFAVCWFGLSGILATVSSRILMGMVFLFIVIPVGLSRKLLGKDSLKLKQFKKSKGSVMVNRDHLYTDADLLHTF